MTGIRLEIQNSTLGSKTKLADKETAKKALKGFDIADTRLSIKSVMDASSYQTGGPMKDTEWLTAPIDYAERLFKLEQLKHMKEKLNDEAIEAVSRGKHLVGSEIALGLISGAVSKIDTQISKLLEDE